MFPFHPVISDALSENGHDVMLLDLYIGVDNKDIEPINFGFKGIQLLGSKHLAGNDSYQVTAAGSIGCRNFIQGSV